MYKRTRDLFLTAVLCSGAVASAGASAGYLPILGPVPLRFRSLPEHEKGLAQLPPPEPVQADSVPATPPSETTEIAVPSALSEQLAPAAGGEPLVMHAASPPPIEEAAPVEEPVSARLFMQYFSPSTNGPQAVVGAPVDFAPPKTAPPPSSSASYSTSP